MQEQQFDKHLKTTNVVEVARRFTYLLCFLATSQAP